MLKEATMTDGILTWFLEQFQSNAVFSGLTGASLIGSAVYLIKDAPQKILKILNHQLVTYMYVTNDDHAFDIIRQWLGELNLTKRTRRLNLSTHENDEGRIYTLTPGTGRHYLIFRRHLLWVERTTGEQTQPYSLRRKETIRISMLGRRQDILQEVIELARRRSEQTNGVIIYFWQNGHWSKSGLRHRRPIETVILPEEQKTRVLSDINWFLNAQNWYFQRGLPYHRGYMLSGPPGTGKSSLVHALASHLGRTIYHLNLSSIAGDGELQEAFAEAPRDGILLIEDIDVFKTTHQRSETGDNDATSGRVSLSGLLNVLDGVGTPDGRIFFLTSNHPDKLDKALLRPGRVDLHERLNGIGGDNVKEFFSKFYPQACDLADAFVESLVDAMTPAELQCLFMQYPDSPAELVMELRKKVA
jgi:chaperone BCS1